MKLKFKEQDFQVASVESVVRIFKGQQKASLTFTTEAERKKYKTVPGQVALGLEDEDEENLTGFRNQKIQITPKQLLKNIQEIQQENEIPEIEEIQKPNRAKIGLNLTIEMETGTGKTYTYIRTMHELYQHYGWSKFIIIVPSIAIREGVNKSFDVMSDHFQEKYGERINYFIYNSKRPQEIQDFATSEKISVMIINKQAFGTKSEAARKIYEELDSFQSRKPIDMIAATNPVLIIDEPQSVEGDTTVKSMERFNALATLRYSATHKNEYNKVYRLDALDAYNRKLVKKIQVKGISLKGSTGTTGYVYLEKVVISKKAPVAWIEIEERTKSGEIKRKRKQVSDGARLFELSGGMPAYKNKIVEINGALNKITIGNDEIAAGEILNNTDEKTFRRIQIRECISSHLEREKQLHKKGIKVISLFFIDAVDKYRLYNDEGEMEKGLYAQMFEEEYNKLKNDYLDLFQQEYNDYLADTDPTGAHRGYLPYLERDDADSVHAGYFSIDKKRAISAFSEVKLKSSLSKAEKEAAQYDLIMKDKERLLSLDEPVRFIFSHSALKEGWDNPNVFQICALKNPDYSSDNRRRQEVGRGMRLCVDSKGNRLDFESVGAQVHDINALTVIASESYEKFAKALQDDIAITLKHRPQKVDIEYFLGKMITDADGEKHRITKEEAKDIYQEFLIERIINRDEKVTDLGRQHIAEGTLPMPKGLEPYKASITKLLKAVYSGEVFQGENDRETIDLRPNKNLKKKEFQELWSKINSKSIYKVNFNDEMLINQSKDLINAQLHIRDKVYEVRSGELQDGTKEEMEAGTLIKEAPVKYNAIVKNIYSNTAYDIVGEIEEKTFLTRATISTILSKLKSEKFLLLRKNPEEFIAKCSRLINEVKASLIYNKVEYFKTEETYDAITIFGNDGKALRSEETLKKHIYDFIKTDSDTEMSFVNDLENSTHIVVYAKLPKKFSIPTPVGPFNPDWAIVLDKETVRHIYFVVETKGSMSDQNLRELEKLKIHCATEHFKAVSGSDVTFDRINSYDNLMEIVQIK
jgi:type III restriction enzyme